MSEPDNLQRVSVPLLMRNGGLGDLTFTPSEFGDPHSVVVTLPRGSRNQVCLPRRWFSAELGLARLRPVAGK